MKTYLVSCLLEVQTDEEDNEEAEAAFRQALLDAHLQPRFLDLEVCLLKEDPKCQKT